VYIAHVQTTIKRLKALGGTIDEETALFHLLEGLPADYDHIVLAVRMPKSEGSRLEWKDIIKMIKTYAQNPDVPGSLSRDQARGQNAHLTQSNDNGTQDNNNQNNDKNKTMPICRDHAKGCCERKNCRFQHVNAPSSAPTAGKQITMRNNVSKG
jgi:hypothetical protein